MDEEYNFSGAIEYFEGYLGKKTCDWKEGMNYTTECGHEISDEVKYMSSDKMIYCCFCGKKIDWK